MVAVPGKKQATAEANLDKQCQCYTKVNQPSILKSSCITELCHLHCAGFLSRILMCVAYNEPWVTFRLYRLFWHQCWGLQAVLVNLSLKIHSLLFDNWFLSHTYFAAFLKSYSLSYSPISFIKVCMPLGTLA